MKVCLRGLRKYSMKLKVCLRRLRKYTTKFVLHLIGLRSHTFNIEPSLNKRYLALRCGYIAFQLIIEIKDIQYLLTADDQVIELG